MDLQAWVFKNKRITFFFTAAIFFLLALATVVTWPDGKLHLVFCDVGQGDAIYIRLPSGKDMLIDGGPDNKVLGCLSQNMPFYDRTIDILLLTHPEKDHLTGFLEVLKRYKVNRVITNKVKHNTSEYSIWTEELRRNKLQEVVLKRGDVIRFDIQMIAEILWPETAKLRNWQKNGTDNLNQTSIILRLSYKNFCALLTGDITLDFAKQATGDRQCAVLKVPHHGSRYNLDGELVSKISPSMAVISDGKNNRYGHPHEEVLKILKDRDVRILRTDQMGEIEIVSDGKTYQIN